MSLSSLFLGCSCHERESGITTFWFLLKILIYWYDVNRPDDKTYIGSNFWPKYHSISMDTLFKYELNEEFNFIPLNDNTYSPKQKEEIRNFIIKQKLLPWNEEKSSLYMPPNSTFPEGLMIIYYPHNSLI